MFHIHVTAHEACDEPSQLAHYLNLSPQMGLHHYSRIGWTQRKLLLLLLHFYSRDGKPVCCQIPNLQHKLLTDKKWYRYPHCSSTALVDWDVCCYTYLDGLSVLALCVVVFKVTKMILILFVKQLFKFGFMCFTNEHN